MPDKTDLTVDKRTSADLERSSKVDFPGRLRGLKMPQDVASEHDTKASECHCSLPHAQEVLDSLSVTEIAKLFVHSDNRCNMFAMFRCWDQYDYFRSRSTLILTVSFDSF